MTRMMLKKVGLSLSLSVAAVIVKFLQRFGGDARLTVASHLCSFLRCYERHTLRKPVIAVTVKQTFANTAGSQLARGM